MADKTPDSESQLKTASNGSLSSSGTSEDSRRFSSYLQSAAQISGVATIIAAAFYALGVVNLYMPLWQIYGTPFSAAWYALSAIPKTVVVGQGITYFAWPALAIMVATTLIALMVLWLLYIMAIALRHAKQTARDQATLSSVVSIYSLLVSLFLASVFLGYTGWRVDTGSGIDLLTSPLVEFYIQSSLTQLELLLAVLFVLLCLAAAVLVVAHEVRYMRTLIASKALPSVSFRSFRGFILKALLLVWLAYWFWFSLLRLGLLDIIDINSWVSVSSYLALVFFPLAFVAVLLLILSAPRYTLKLLRKEELVMRQSHVFASTVLYPVVLVFAFLIVGVGAINVLYYFIFPLISGRVSESNLLLVLVVLGTLINLTIMYRTGWRGLGRGEYNFFSQGAWLTFARDLLMSIGSRTLRSGLFWSLGVACVSAFAIAFILAASNPLPLPSVSVNEVAQAQSDRSRQESAVEGKRLALLAHAEGYWYLIDNRNAALLVVPDQADKFIRLDLSELPQYGH
jgi:hypothetical protein